MPFEILNRAFVFLCRCLAGECAEIFSFARSRIFLAGIQPILAGFKFPNQNDSLAALVTATRILPKTHNEAE
jgi:hypothetical protein